ncbi:neuronal acetylcholine receptor subunit alpha-6-like [Babylonia areolata]|uniref:neuronal acetylcholine receptor subunit alpha-6-like n=1 Tax=Babylonia areolata TaxID=304850 RepID=UPI003FD3DB16
MDTRLQINVILVIAVSWAIQWGAAEGRSIKADKAVKGVLRTMAKLSRPLRLPPSPNNTKTPVTLVVDFGLTSVTEVNAESGYVDLEGLLSEMWADPRLKFDMPKAGRNIHTVRVLPKTIWTPDLAVYNAMAPGLQTLTNPPPMAVVSRAGDVHLSSQVKVRVPCDVMGQLTHEDHLNCTMKMGSWTYNGLELDLAVRFPSGDKLGDFQATGLWTATSSRAWAGADKYACCVETFPFVRFSFFLRKRSGITLDN